MAIAAMIPRTRPFPLTARFIALGAVFWTTVASLFAIQATLRNHVTFGAAFGESIVSFVPCILLTPAIALLAVRFRVSETTPLRSAVALTAGLAGVLTIGGGMMGLFEWLPLTAPPTTMVSATGAAMAP